MKNNLPLPQEKKITIVVRVESGCLGPDGNALVEEFCSAAHLEFKPIDSDFINWEVVPRFDKSLPEIGYKIVNKILTYDQAAKYLELFNKNLNEFEERVNEKLAVLIEQHMER